MNRFVKSISWVIVAGTCAAAATAAEPVRLQGSDSSVPTPAPSTSGVAKSSLIAGAALALKRFDIWRNAMPRALKPGEKDPGSPLIVKAEVEAKGGAKPAKLTWKAQLVPAGAAAQDVAALEVNADGKPFSGDVKAGETVFLEFYSKSPSTLAPGTKAKIVLTFTSGAETVTLEEEGTVEKVD